MPEFLASTLLAICEQVGARPIQHIAREPGVKVAYRLTVRYHDRRAADSVATLRWANDASLNVIYRGLFAHKPVVFTLDTPRAETFAQEVQKLNFDRLHDQSNIPPHGVDLWLLERAAGSFYKGVVIAPELTGSVYARLAFVVNLYLPEAVRTINDATPRRRPE